MTEFGTSMFLLALIQILFVYKSVIDKWESVGYHIQYTDINVHQAYVHIYRLQYQYLYIREYYDV